jgi:geranylgeranyl pyrophosphate synthase
MVHVDKPENTAVEQWIAQLELDLVATMNPGLALRQPIGLGLESAAPAQSAILHEADTKMTEALRYPLAAGGKRIRPRFCLLLALALGGHPVRENALKAAKAIELVHTYSLVHDDLPCMDDDDLRRGQPTTHKVFGEAKALLVGDALLTEAFLTVALLQTNTQPHIASLSVQILALASGHRGMVAGQWLDVSAAVGEASGESPLAALESTHTLKTGCLLGAAAELGTLCGLNEREISTQSASQLRDLARGAGLELGLAFQIVDDLLDASATSAELGKTAGKDVLQGKATAVTLLGPQAAEREAARLTETAMGKLNQLFDRVTPPDDMANEARGQLMEFVRSLVSRRS